MEKPFKFGMIIGRFNHATVGHVEMIKKGLAMCDTLLVLVGSSQESGTVRNPFDVGTRISLLQDLFEEEEAHDAVIFMPIDDMTNEDDHSKEWGDYVLHHIEQARAEFDIKEQLDCMVYGNDEEREGWYRPESIVNVSHVVLSRNTIPISATMMRELLATNQYPIWRSFMSDRLDTEDGKIIFEQLRSKLLEIPYYKELGEAKNA